MRRRFSAGLIAALIATSAGAAPLDAERDCRVIDLLDTDRRGAQVVGAEDIVFDPAHERFAIAAFARNVPAAKMHDDGGLYLVKAAAFRQALRRPDGMRRVETRALTFGDRRPFLFKPHGIDVSADGETIMAVQRQDRTDAEERSRIVRLERDGETWRARVIAQGEAVCRANDVAIARDGRMIASLDRGACGGFWMMVENVFALAGGSIVEITPDASPAPVLSDLLVANGVIAHEGGLVIAETREDRILWLDAGRERDDPTLETPLGASPDNINRAPDGGLLITAHDSLFRLALHRSFGDRFDPPGGVVFHLSDADRGRETPPEPLLRIPGEIFAGPTSAAAGGGVLLVGSATAAGVLACHWAPEKEDP